MHVSPPGLKAIPSLPLEEMVDPCWLVFKGQPKGHQQFAGTGGCHRCVLHLPPRVSPGLSGRGSSMRSALQMTSRWMTLARRRRVVAPSPNGPALGCYLQGNQAEANSFRGPFEKLCSFVLRLGTLLGLGLTRYLQSCVEYRKDFLKPRLTLQESNRHWIEVTQQNPSPGRISLSLSLGPRLGTARQVSLRAVVARVDRTAGVPAESFGRVRRWVFGLRIPLLGLHQREARRET